MKIFILPKRVIVTVAIAIFVVLALIPVSRPKEVPVSGRGPVDLPIYSVETSEKKVAVTFNAAWDDSDIDSILRTLSDYNCKCTFFLVGTWAEKYPKAAQKIRDAGHEIASHSKEHAHYAGLTPTEVQTDVEEGDTIIKEVTGIDITLFRAPYGEYTAELVQYCRETGRYCIQWDVEPMAAVGKPLPVRA
ncbi:MAG: polysaccharide deacetylase family protein [Clostridia bacterium]|nr:polysaccharide deacetylase family protein [Clostridia bacterium]